MYKVFSVLALMATLGLSAQSAPLLHPQATASHAHAMVKVRLNTATSRELRSLPGVGELLAQRIIAARPLRRVEDLKTLKGLAPDDYQRIKPLVTL